MDVDEKFQAEPSLEWDKEAVHHHSDVDHNPEPGYGLMPTNTDH